MPTIIHTDDQGHSIQFACVDCGGHLLEEIMTDVTVASVIESVEADGELCYGEQANDGGGAVRRYQCATCGRALPCTDGDELFAYLIRNQRKGH